MKYGGDCYLVTTLPSWFSGPCTQLYGSYISLEDIQFGNNIFRNIYTHISLHNVQCLIDFKYWLCLWKKCLHVCQKKKSWWIQMICVWRQWISLQSGRYKWHNLVPLGDGKSASTMMTQVASCICICICIYNTYDIYIGWHINSCFPSAMYQQPLKIITSKIFS